MRYNLNTAIYLANNFINNNDCDPRKYSKIRSCLCEWIMYYNKIKNSKEAKKKQKNISITINKLDEYFMNRIDYLKLFNTKK